MNKELAYYILGRVAYLLVGFLIIYQVGLPLWESDMQEVGQLPLSEIPAKYLFSILSLFWISIMVGLGEIKSEIIKINKIDKE